MQAFTAASPLTCLIFRGKLLKTTENEKSKFTPGPSSKLSLPPNLQLFSAHMESLKQKTENTEKDKQKSSLGNASSNPSESVLHTLGKDFFQELHDKLMHYTFKSAAKRAFR